VVVPGLDDELPDAKHGGEEDSMIQHPLDVRVEGHWRPTKRPVQESKQLQKR